MRIRHRIPLLFAFVCTVALAPGCGSDGPSGPSFEISFDSGMPRSARDDAVRVEVYLVDACSEVTLGVRPVPSIASTYVVRDGHTGTLGGAEAGDYGLYAVAQDQHCAVVAAGCAPVTVGDENETLAVTLGSVQGEACPADRVCSMETGNCEDGSGGTGGMGGSSGDPLVRVSDGLIVLYDFDEGSGTTVVDQSGVSPLLDLFIADNDNVSWGAGYLSVNTGTIISSPGGAAKVFNRVVRNDAITLEAWVRPATLVAVGTPPDRIVSMSQDSSNRNFLLGQDATTYAIRYRTPGEDNGNPTIPTTPGSTRVELQHVVFTHSADGSEVIYIDGVANTANTRVGDTSTWDPSYPLVLANEASGDREWLGELHLVAIYDRALDANEVEQNFDAGP